MFRLMGFILYLLWAKIFVKDHSPPEGSIHTYICDLVLAGERPWFHIYEAILKLREGA